MHFGVSMFHTDYSIPATELARGLETRGFESIWAPEHSHIPIPRRTPFPGGGEVPRPYYEVMDPFVVLSAAAAVTKTLKLATGVCLVVQRDPIQTAKLVASIDQVSGGRFLFGVGGLECRGNRGPWHGLQNPLQADARADRGDEGDLDQGQGRISRRVRRFPDDDDMAKAGSETLSADHRWRGLSPRSSTCHSLR